jgi:hypothetical protein
VEQPFGPVPGHARRFGVRAEQRRHDRAVADHDGADEPLLAHDQLLVDAPRRLGICDDFVIFVRGLFLAHHREIDARHFELRRRARTHVDRARIASAQSIGEHLGLFPQRRDEAVHAPAVLSAFADGIHIRHAREVVADDDAALDGKSGASCELHVRTHAGGNHHHVAVERRPVLEGHTGHRSVAEHFRGRRVEPDVQAHLLELPLQDPGACRVELRFHQVRHQMDDVHLEAGIQQAARRLESEQPASNHDRAARAAHERQHAIAIGQRSEDEDAALERLRAVASARATVRFRQAADRRNLRPAAGRHHERVERLDLAVSAADALRGDVYLLDANAGMERHLVAGVPRQRIEEDVLRVVASRQHAGKQDSVVVAARLVTEDGELIGVSAAARQNLLDEASAGHSVADDDQPPLLRHSTRSRVSSMTAGATTRTAHTLNSGMRLTGSSAGLVRRLIA